MAPSHHTLRPPPLALRQEIFRKTLHLTAMAIPVAYFIGVQRGVLEIVLAAAGTVALLLELLRLTNDTAGSAFVRTFGPLLRDRERQSVTGATWLALSCLVAVVMLSRGAAIAALWCATVGDPCATIAGRIWSANRVPETPSGDGKTIVGSMACALASFLGVWLLAGYSPVAAAAVAATAAAAEAIPTRLDDNIRVTGAAGAIAQALA